VGLSRYLFFGLHKSYLYIYFRVFCWQGTRNVEALELYCLKECQSFKAEEFKELRNLRYLRVDNADLDGDFTDIFFNLRWLQWSYCRRQFSPSNIDLKNLVILDLSYNKSLKDNWEGWSQIKVSKNIFIFLLFFFPFFTSFTF
jgi:hypothetical protein